MKTVHEVSELSGVSVRTLHHYDAIGLLRPAAVSPAGYRLYDAAALERLQNILLFRQLEFPLKEIASILDSPGFDRAEALKQQIELLRLQSERIGKMIDLARDLMKKGEGTMDFTAFDNSQAEQYKEQAKKRWGNTAAWAEYEKKSDGKSMKEQNDVNAGIMEFFVRMGAIKELPPSAVEAQAAVKELQQYITRNMYNCTDGILAGLGEMYSADERFAANIDAAGGQGTAAFASEAIRIYCGTDAAR